MLVLAALMCAASAPAQRPGSDPSAHQVGTGTTAQQVGTGGDHVGSGTGGDDVGSDTSGGETKLLSVTIDAPAEGEPVPASGDILFSANKPGATFRCVLGSVEQNPCTSPVHYGPLRPGQQLFFAVFASRAGARGADRAIYTVAARPAPPPLTVTITSAPLGTVARRVATMSFTANRPGADFRCTLDGVGAPCSSPQRYRDLSNGTHEFSVVAHQSKDTSPPKRTSWTVAGVEPNPTPRLPRAVITSAPEGAVVSRQARLAFTAAPAASHFQCSLDDSAFVSCRSPRSYARLALRSHTFRVRALAASGAVGPSDIARWTVDTPSSSSNGDKSPIVVVALVAAGGLLAAAMLLTLRRVTLARRRARWQLEARSEPPENPCSKGSHYCQKTQVNLKPPRRRIDYLVLHARDGDRSDLDKHVAGRVVGQLNRALRDYRRNQDRDRLRTMVLPSAGLLLNEIELWLADDFTRQEITADAHTIVSEIECEFALYACKDHGDLRQWENEDRWMASVKDESEESAVRLDRPDALGAKVESATHQLTDFLIRLDTPAHVQVSTEGALKL